MGTLQPQSSGPLYSNAVLHLVQRRGAWAGCGLAQSRPRCTKCYSPPINGQYTNFILVDVALRCKGLNDCEYVPNWCICASSRGHVRRQ